MQRERGILDEPTQPTPHRIKDLQFFLQLLPSSTLISHQNPLKHALCSPDLQHEDKDLTVTLYRLWLEDIRQWERNCIFQHEAINRFNRSPNGTIFLPVSSIGKTDERGVEPFFRTSRCIRFHNIIERCIEEMKVAPRLLGIHLSAECQS